MATQTLNLANYLSNNQLQQTRLDAITAASTAALTVLNNNGFTAADFFVLGTLGSEVTELLTVQSVTGETTITPTASTTLDHNRYDYVTKLFGDQIKVYRAANVNGLPPADSDFGDAIATIDLDVDRAYTEYTDPDGGPDWWYKFTYFNSTTNSETNLADSQAVRGGSVGDYCSIESIRQEAGFMSATYITGQMIDDKRQAAQREIDSTLVGSYTVPFTQPVNPFIADICKRLAAGLLLLEQYGQLQRQNTMDGTTKVAAARADLQKIALGNIKLTDSTGTSTALPDSSGAAASWPNETTATAPRYEGGARRAFRMGDLEGYHERRF